MPLFRPPLPFLAIIACFLFSDLYSQDGHYWTEHYGSRSMLLNGVVIGSGSDLGMVYYNPGRLGTLDNPSFLLSAQVYELFRYRIEDGVGNDQDLTDSQFGGAPSLVAGTFQIPKWKKHKFAYSFLTRHRDNSSLFLISNERGDLIDNLPGEEDFVGKFRWIKQSKDDWLGLTWSYPLSEAIGIGVSTYLSARQSLSYIDLNLSALSQDNQVAILHRNRELTYDAFGVLWKAGISLNLPGFSAGMTVTTPKVHLTGKGSMIIQDMLTGIDTSGNGEHEEALIFTAQEDLPAQHKSPWSIGLGVGIPIGKSKIHLSSAWYNAIPKYSLMEIEPFIGQSDSQTYTFKLVDEFSSVLNAGIGAEIFINPALSGYASFATDFSAVKGDISRSIEFGDEASNSTLQGDLFHTGLGLSFKLKRWELTLGTSRAWATETIRRPINFPDEGEDGVFESEASSQVKYERWRFIFAFTFSFRKPEPDAAP